MRRRNFAMALASLPAAPRPAAAATVQPPGRLELPWRGGTTRVAVHEYHARDVRAPLIVASGGVDSFKVEIHRLCMFFAGVVGCRVAAIDMPGTGESELDLEEDAHAVYAGTLAALRRDAGASGAFGISFGGHWAMRLALARAVDFAVGIGGPTGEARPAGDGGLPNGMGGILRAALGLAQATPHGALTARLQRFALPSQPEGDSVPLLIVNGERDPYVPPRSYARLATSPAVTTWIVKGDAHCAPATFGRLLPAVQAWVRHAVERSAASQQRQRELERGLVQPLLA